MRQKLTTCGNDLSCTQIRELLKELYPLAPPLITEEERKIESFACGKYFANKLISDHAKLGPNGFDAEAEDPGPSCQKHSGEQKAAQGYTEEPKQPTHQHKRPPPRLSQNPSQQKESMARLSQSGQRSSTPQRSSGKRLPNNQ